MFLKTLLVILAFGAESKVLGLECYNSNGWKNQQPLDTEQNKKNCDAEKKCFGAWSTGIQDQDSTQNLFSCAKKTFLYQFPSKISEIFPLTDVEFSGEVAGMKSHIRIKYDKVLDEEIMQGKKISTNLKFDLKINDKEIGVETDIVIGGADFDFDVEDIKICAGDSEKCLEADANIMNKLPQFLSENKKLTIKSGNMKIGVTTKGNFTALFTKPTFDVTVMMKIQAENSFAKLEISGDTSKEKLNHLRLEDLLDLSGHKNMVMMFKQFQARACSAEKCFNIKQCPENLCNKQSELTFPSFKMDGNSSAIGLGIGIFLIIAVVLGLGIYCYRKKRNQ